MSSEGATTVLQYARRRLSKAIEALRKAVGEITMAEEWCAGACLVPGLEQWKDCLPSATRDLLGKCAEDFPYHANALAAARESLELQLAALNEQISSMQPPPLDQE